MGGREAAGVRIIRNAWAVIIFMVLEVGGRVAAGFRIIRNAKDISWFWKWAGGENCFVLDGRSWRRGVGWGVCVSPRGTRTIAKSMEFY